MLRNVEAAEGGDGAQDAELRLSFGIPEKEQEDGIHSWAG